MCEIETQYHFAMSLPDHVCVFLTGDLKLHFFFLEALARFSGSLEVFTGSQQA